MTEGFTAVGAPLEESATSGVNGNAESTPSPGAGAVYVFGTSSRAARFRERAPEAIHHSTAAAGAPPRGGDAPRFFSAARRRACTRSLWARARAIHGSCTPGALALST